MIDFDGRNRHLLYWFWGRIMIGPIWIEFSTSRYACNLFKMLFRFFNVEPICWFCLSFQVSWRNWNHWDWAFVLSNGYPSIEFYQLAHRCALWRRTLDDYARCLSKRHSSFDFDQCFPSQTKSWIATVCYSSFCSSFSSYFASNFCCSVTALDYFCVSLLIHCSFCWLASDSCSYYDGPQTFTFNEEHEI